MRLQPRIGPAWLLATGLGAALAAACAHAPQPVKAADAASAPAAAAASATEATPGTPDGESSPAQQPDPSASSPAEDAASPADEGAERRRATLIVIDPGGEEEEGVVDIAAAAHAERERRAKAPPASRVITNKNLVKAEDGKTKVKPSAKPPAPPAAEKAPAAAAPTDRAAGEEYWRTRSYDLRLRWKEAVDEIEDLERDADGLRRRFYAESDPYVRDTRVKPDWDRVLDRIREMADVAERRRRELEAHLEEGRKAGALPGWLREGIELEPAPRAEAEGPGPVESVEPPTYPEPITEPPRRP